MKRVRCYDNGGETADRYTIVFTAPVVYDGRKRYQYIAANDCPTNPTFGFYQHGETHNYPSASGKRIPFSKLPAELQKLVNTERV